MPGAYAYRSTSWLIASTELWARNLTDDRYVSASIPGFPAYYPTVPRPIDFFYGDGRRMGLTVRFDYDGR